MAQRPETYGNRLRGNAPRGRVRRFTNVGQMLARVFAGYKLISLREKRKGTTWGEARRAKHHYWSANKFYEAAVCDVLHVLVYIISIEAQDAAREEVFVKGCFKLDTVDNDLSNFLRKFRGHQFWIFFEDAVDEIDAEFEM